MESTPMTSLLLELLEKLSSYNSTTKTRLLINKINLLNNAFSGVTFFVLVNSNLRFIANSSKCYSASKCCKGKTKSIFLISSLAHSPSHVSFSIQVHKYQVQIIIPLLSLYFFILTSTITLQIY